ncbi:MAG: carbamoyltransferase HypF [Acidobacteriota bacterium]
MSLAPRRSVRPCVATLMVIRKRIQVQGVVQGVGFRPFVHRLAVGRDLTGLIFNSMSGVIIEIQGGGRALEDFERALRSELPPLARIDSLQTAELKPRADEGFVILESEKGQEAGTLVSPDAATCEECLREVADPTDRRFRYAFTNCTHCGPRYTIIRDLPYDRARTTMDLFVMCRECQAEYFDPTDRRFHAQPNACPRCGPSLVWSGGVEGSSDPMAAARVALERGEVVAVRGLGGFQLVCDAGNEGAVLRLRERKRRSEKPFAVMVPDLAAAERLCILSEDERSALVSRERPIVILERRTGNAHLALGNDTLGVMLPYTPLHQMLVQDFAALVVTSGNVSEEPIVIDNDRAADRLAPIADSFLLHDRGIHTRVDDSVVRVFEGRTRLLRRARGFAPGPIDLGRDVPQLLACGAQLKNTFCLTRGSQAFVSQHIGDLENYETLQFFEETLERMKRLFRVTPTVVAHDLHPDYLSTRYALALDGVRRIAVQHHHAHIASCMAEHGLRERVIGVAFDGTGLGTDGTIWGGEFLSADLSSFERRAHLRPVSLPGGDAAVRQPWRMALSHLLDAGLRDVPLGGVKERDRALVTTMIERQINSVPTSSAGRLFDAVASIIGVRHEATFEAQAAIELETLARANGPDSAYRYDIGERVPMEIDFRPTIRAIVEDRGRGVMRSRMAARFHETVAAVIEDVCVRIRDGEALNRVCLSGGTFQNWLLLENALRRLRKRGFEVFSHALVPPNDGGIALGQAAVAGERLAGGL